MPATNMATSRRDCLVVYIQNDEELQRALREGYYRIPEREVGRAIGEEGLAEADMIALYQGGSVEIGIAGAIEFVAPIKARERARRRDLIPDEPRHPHANEKYVVLRLGRRRRLSRPIVSARPRRFTFMRTTRGRIRQASTLSDLIVGDRHEERLWKSVKRSTGVVRESDKERRWLVRAGNTTMEVDVALFHGDRRVAIVRDGADVPSEPADGWRVVRFSPATPDDEVLRIVEQMLGPSS